MIDAIKELLVAKYYSCESEKSKLNDRKSGMTVSISHKSATALVICVPEKGKAHMQMIKDEPGYKITCDKLIFIKKNGSIDVYFIEMKRTLRLNSKGVPKEACQQILATVPALDYLVSMANAHFEKKQKINSFFVVIGECMAELDKQPVKPKNFRVCEHRHHKFKVISSVATDIPINHLQWQTLSS